MGGRSHPETEVDLAHLRYQPFVVILGIVGAKYEIKIRMTKLLDHELPIEFLLGDRTPLVVTKMIIGALQMIHISRSAVQPEFTRP